MTKECVSSCLLISTAHSRKCSLLTLTAKFPNWPPNYTLATRRLAHLHISGEKILQHTAGPVLSNALGKRANDSFSFNVFLPNNLLWTFSNIEQKLKEFFSEHLNAFHLDSAISILLHFLDHITIPLSISLSVHQSVLFLMHFQVNCSTVPLNSSACCNGFDEENGCISPNQLGKSNFREANKGRGNYFPGTKIWRKISFETSHRVIL